MTMTSKILRLPQVMQECGLAQSTIYLRINEGLMPPPIALGGRIVGWPESEIAAINTARIAGKTDDEVRDLVKALETHRKAGCQHD